MQLFQVKGAPKGSATTLARIPQSHRLNTKERRREKQKAKEKVREIEKPFPTYKTQTKTAAEMTQRNSIPTFFRPANFQIQWNNLSFSLSILEGFLAD